MNTNGTIFTSTNALFSTDGVAAIGISIELPLDRLIRLRDDLNVIIRERQDQELADDFERRKKDDSFRLLGFVDRTVEAPDYTDSARWYHNSGSLPPLP